MSNEKKLPAHEVILEMLGETIDELKDLQMEEDDFWGIKVTRQLSSCIEGLGLLCKILQRMVIPKQELKSVINCLRNLRQRYMKTSIVVTFERFHSDQPTAHNFGFLVDALEKDLETD